MFFSDISTYKKNADRGMRGHIVCCFEIFSQNSTQDNIFYIFAIGTIKQFKYCN